MKWQHFSLAGALFLSACGAPQQDTRPINGPRNDGGGAVNDPPPQGDVLDQALAVLIEEQDLNADPLAGRELPSIDDPLAQLGMRLFFSKSLGGAFDSACVSCHHPALGGADALSLPVGVGAIDPDLLGPGRSHAADGIPNVPRNAPTTFNLALWDRKLFHDGRVESLDLSPGSNGAGGAIRTPDSGFGTADTAAGANLSAAQARFPVTSAEEMRAGLLAGEGNEALRARLAARLGNYGDGAGELEINEWLPAFQQAYGASSTAEELITFDHIAEAIGEYERSQLFVNNPWRDYMAGDLEAISDAAKRGARLFFSRPQDGGAGCAACHNGPAFTDEDFHTVAFPMIGHGKGDGVDAADDFGRERETGDARDRYAFRTPSLLNVALTAPYGRTGSYETLNDVLRHYDNPTNAVGDFFDDGGWCQLRQFADLPAAECAALYPQARANSEAALLKLQQDRAANRSRLPNVNLNRGERADLRAFLEALTDPCLTDPACYGAWVPADDGGPDGQQLSAINTNGDAL